MDLSGAFLYFMVMCFSRAKFSRCPRQRCGSSAGRKLLHWRGDWGALQLGRWGCEAEKSQQPTSWKMLKDVDSLAATGIVYDSICQGKPGNIRQALCLVVFSRSRWCRKFLWIPWSKSGMKATSMRPSSKLTSDTLALQVFTTWSTWCWWRADGHWNCSSCPLRRVAIWECAKKNARQEKSWTIPKHWLNLPVRTHPRWTHPLDFCILYTDCHAYMMHMNTVKGQHRIYLYSGWQNLITFDWFHICKTSQIVPKCH